MSEHTSTASTEDIKSSMEDISTTSGVSRTHTPLNGFGVEISCQYHLIVCLPNHNLKTIDFVQNDVYTSIRREGHYMT